MTAPLLRLIDNDLERIRNLLSQERFLFHFIQGTFYDILVPIPSPSKETKCYFVICALRTRSRKDILPNPFNPTTFTETDVSPFIQLLSDQNYDDDDYQNILDIIIAIWYVIKLIHYTTHDVIYQTMTILGYSSQDILQIADEKIREKLDIFSSVDLNLVNSLRDLVIQ
jgi:hypothetical protein